MLNGSQPGRAGALIRGRGARLSFHPEEASVQADTAFFDFAPSQFPIQIWVLDAVTNELCWHVKIEGVAAVMLPSRRDVNNCKPVTVAVRDATGKTYVAEPSRAVLKHPCCRYCGDCLTCDGDLECSRGGDHDLELSYALEQGGQ